MGGEDEEGREVEGGILTHIPVINRHVLTYTYSLHLMYRTCVHVRLGLRNSYVQIIDTNLLQIICLVLTSREIKFIIW